MTQSGIRFFDELAKYMTNTTDYAVAMQREFDTLVRAQTEKLMSSWSVVRREEFELVRDTISKIREENEALRDQLKKLEARVK